jgi:hypothetical protein
MPHISSADINSVYEADDTPFPDPSGQSGWKLSQATASGGGYWDIEGRVAVRNRAHQKILLAKKAAALAENEAIMNLEIRHEVFREEAVEKEIRAVSALELKSRDASKAEALKLLIMEQALAQNSQKLDAKNALEEKVTKLKLQRRQQRALRQEEMARKREAKAQLLRKKKNKK